MHPLKITPRIEKRVGESGGQERREAESYQPWSLSVYPVAGTHEWQVVPPTIPRSCRLAA